MSAFPSAMKAPRDLPRRRLLAFGQVRKPRTRHFVQADTVFRSGFVRPQVDDVLAIDLVGTENARLDLMREALIGLLHGRNQIQGGIERRHALCLEPGATDRGTLPGERLEGPSRIVRAM
jgi:hypothetical protein